MIKSERLKIIKDMVNTKNVVSINEIVDKLGVSDMTVRRDLSSLEKEGVIERVHGGAKARNENNKSELSHEAKMILNIELKQNIALKALSLIDEGDTIFIGPGTTMEILASTIPESFPITAITNCLPVFQTLNSNNITSYLLGGEMRNKTQSFFGMITLQALERLHFDKAFFSANGIKDGNAVTATFIEGSIQQEALKNSERKYLVIDSTKIDKSDFYAYYALDNLTALITNDDDQHNYQTLEEYVDVIVAN